jgi:hypothetical protein
MTERSEVHVTVDCSPQRGEPVTGAPHTGRTWTHWHDWQVNQ